ncbi:peptidoglycan-binding protein [Aureimonas pseudogalii]|uniref:Localization factor PodJL n=1 Tax=Aureimonas pseudogalii TaxID=1744844 RepID=A0A7W6H683_9HYPH|nr:peptidoglycan-binding protein [Aureimonas pseudogalii]MBB3999311.1 localization factor PodJL [Aureimonas pseudogalii]
MSPNEPRLKVRADTQTRAADPSFSSLSKTLEDLEARLSRLAVGRRPDPAEAASVEPPHAEVTPAAAEAPTPDSPSVRLRAMTASRRSRKPALEEAVSTMTVERQLNADPVSKQPAPRTPAPRAKASTSDRRFGTIAGEVEQLQMQSATLTMVKDLASELTALRADIVAQTAPDLSPRLEELRHSFSDLKTMIAERQGADRIGAEIFEIMEALTELTVGTADQTSIDALRTELDSVATMVGQLAREESVEAVQRRWDDFESRIADRIELDNQAKRDLRVELERLRGSLRSLATEEQILAVQQRWEEFESRYLESSRIQTEETLTRFLRDELGGLRTKLDLIAEASSPEALDARFGAMAERFSTGDLEAGIARLSDRMGEIELALVGLPEILQIDQMEGRIQALADSVERLAAEMREPDLEQFGILEERLDEISAAIVTATAYRQVELDMAPIERIEARVAELASRVDRLAESGEADLLSVQIAALAERIEDMGARPDADLGQRIDTLSERVETLFARAESGAGAAAFEDRLNKLAARLEESAGTKGVDPTVVQALEMQVGRLADHLAGTPGLGGEEGTEITRRLDVLERQLDENRDSILVAARTAADEAVRRMQDEDGRRENVYVRELAQDLRNLEALCRDSDERAYGVFDAVHATLSKIVERLTGIEAELRGQNASSEVAMGEAASVAPASAQTPVTSSFETAALASVVADEPKGLRAAINRRLSRRPAVSDAAPSLAERVHPPLLTAEEALDDAVEPSWSSTVSPSLDAPSLDAADQFVSREANRPLEPGSGAPDIAALIERVRLQQRGLEPASAEPIAKADFIAAARKAAMAAAAEAEAQRDRQGDESGPHEDKAGRRKPILMAVGAVLLALMAIPLGAKYLADDGAGLEAIVADAGPARTLDAPSTEIAATTAPAASAEPASSLAAPVVDLAAETVAPALAVAPSIVAEPASAEAPPVPSEAERASAAMPAGDAAGPAVAALPEAAESEPAVAEAAAIAAPAATAGATLLASAEAKLPTDARGAMPAMPADIGPKALTDAAVKGEPVALFEVGLRLMEGRTGAPDPAAAMTWFARSASLGFAPAQYSLGTLFEKGNGAARDTGAARDWYRLAADQGNVRAMHNLAVLYATGIEGVSDPETAAQWFVKAAQHGMPDSQYNLGILYARGAGVPQDLGESYRWFKIVGQSGDKDALAKMGEVGKSLAPDVRTRIDAEVAAWKPTPRVEFANTVDIPSDWAGKGNQTASVDMTRAIRNVQAILIKLGFDPGRPDGIVGEQTETAIRRFQEKSGLQATGKVDEPLIRALLERKDA